MYKNLFSNFKKKPFIIDAHFDILLDVQQQRAKGRTKVIENDYYNRFIDGGVDVIVAAVFVDSSFLPFSATQNALSQISALYQEVNESSDKLMICYNKEDMQYAYENSKIGFLLSLEGSEPIGLDINLLTIFYELGVRNLGLVWSRRNEVGDGAHFSPVREGKKGGITNFGIEVIEEAERLGMTIDVTHLNDEGFEDVVNITNKPFIASHSNARTICNTMRNLTDDQIRAITEKNGVIGINAVSILVGDTDMECTLEKLADHVDYLVDKVGVNHVGIGLDLCDDFIKYMDPEDIEEIPRMPFDVLKGHNKLPDFIDILMQRGYTEEELNLLLGENFLRVFDFNMNNK